MNVSLDLALTPGHGERGADRTGVALQHLREAPEGHGRRCGEPGVVRRMIAVGDEPNDLAADRLECAELQTRRTEGVDRRPGHGVAARALAQEEPRRLIRRECPCPKRGSSLADRTL